MPLSILKMSLILCISRPKFQGIACPFGTYEQACGIPRVFMNPVAHRPASTKSMIRTSVLAACLRCRRPAYCCSVELGKASKNTPINTQKTAVRSGLSRMLNTLFCMEYLWSTNSVLPVACHSSHALNPRNKPTAQKQPASASENVDGNEIDCNPIQITETTKLALSMPGSREIQITGANTGLATPSMSNAIARCNGRATSNLWPLQL